MAGTSVSGSCTVDTPLGTFGGTFTGTVGINGSGSGTITLDGGPLGSLNGTWTGTLTGKSASITYTVQTLLGPISGTLPVSLN